MSAPGLRSLTVEHLRGSTKPFTLSFQKGKSLTVVYGENGTGKTTICDALELLSKGKIGSLEGRGLGPKPERYWPTIGKSAADVAVVLETGDGTCTAKIVKSAVVVAPLGKRPRVEVLRRSQILRLLEAQPAARYAEISRFIDVSGIEASEVTLKQLIETLARNRDTAVAVVLENENAIRQFWNTAGKPDADPLTWAAAETSKDITDLDALSGALSQLRAAYQRLADYPDKFSAATAQLSAARDGVAEAEQSLAAALDSATEGAGELVSLLEAARPVLSRSPHPQNCPLCESSENASTLHERVEERLNQFAAIQSAKRNKTTADAARRTAESTVTRLAGDFASDRKLYERTKDAPVLTGAVELPKYPIPVDLTLLAPWLTSNSGLPQAWLQREAGLQDQKKFIGTLKQALGNYQSNVAAQKELDDLLPKLRRAIEITADERRKFTDGALKQIADEVGRLYEAVHPGEGLGKIGLMLDPDKRASLEIEASFAGSSTPPQAYFSQSHLDTLGLCVFLALSGLDQADDTILVLDDVLASVDEPHVDRLIEMLHAEAAKFRHCIITTHYRPWRQKFRWGWLKNGQCHFVELTKWTQANGIKLIRTIPDVSALRQLLVADPPDPQLISAKAGVVLEAVLDFLTLLYRCHVPRMTDDSYTLGELLPAIDKKLRPALRVEVHSGLDSTGAPVFVSRPLGTCLDEISRIAQVRNVMGCHFNKLSHDLLDSDAISFAELVLQLVDALVDEDAGWPKSDKSGSYWGNGSDTRRMHPLKRPS